MHDLTGFQRDLLFVIVGLDDSSGLTIKKELEEYHESQIHDSRLYENLDSLVESGLVEKADSQRDNRSNSYRATESGARKIESRRAWEDQYLATVESSAVSP